MPRPMTTELEPLEMEKPVGVCLSEIRKQKGMTQKELAEQIGIKQTLVSDYEVGRLHLSDEMLIRFARALDTSADSLLGLSKESKDTKPVSLKVMRRAKEIEDLPLSDQKKVLQNLDLILQGVKRS